MAGGDGRHRQLRVVVEPDLDVPTVLDHSVKDSGINGRSAFSVGPPAGANLGSVRIRECAKCST